MRMVPRQDGTYNGHNWDRILGKAGWGLYRQRGTVSMRTNPKEGPALEQAITGYNDSKWHHYGVSISSAASGRRNWLITLDGKLQGSGTTDTQGLAPDSSLLAIGGYSVPTSYYISEVRLWKKDLAEREFLQLSGEIDIEPSSDMLGYWKFKPTEQLENLNTKYVFNSKLRRANGKDPVRMEKMRNWCSDFSSSQQDTGRFPKCRNEVER